LLGERWTTGTAAKFWHLTDGRASSRLLLDSDQQIVATFDYKAFGELWQSTGNLPTTRRFVSYGAYEYELESDLYFLAHRYYDPNLARFLSLDPTWFGINWYLYALNDPINLFEWFGLEPTNYGYIVVIETDQTGTQWLRITKIINLGQHPPKLNPGQNILITGSGSKELAKNIAEKLAEGSIFHHDSHYSLNIATPLPHYQFKKPFMAHVFYAENITKPLRPGSYLRSFSPRPIMHPTRRWMPRGFRGPRSSGGGLGAVATVVEGAGIFAEGARVVIPYARNVKTIINEDPSGRHSIIDEGLISLTQIFYRRRSECR
jgi:RHS repeat-associated protein